ncbi:MAG: glutamyl-tRNA reductase [Nitrospirae bacterium RBG_16_64_22]|nr:MAG: glutamyl-tRNA reductase [Nitrospirae bacterium RBG_16_64_22]
MNNVIVMGVSYKTAPVEVRERLAVSQRSLADALEGLRGLSGSDEVAFLSTCNRVEVVARPGGSGERSADPFIADVREFLSRHHGIPREVLDPVLYVHAGRDAVRHLFRVASSLDSMVLGEPQVLGQFKSAFEAAMEAGTTGPVLNRLFQKAIQVAKRVRTETRIAENAVSVSYAAVELAKQIFDDLGQKEVLLIGAGEMGELAARHLVAAGAKKVLVASRTIERAAGLADELGGRAISFEEFPGALREADIAISCTDAPRTIIHAETVQRIMRERKGRPIFFIDIAVPRDIDADVGDLENVYLYNIDDLQAVVDQNLDNRRMEAERAEAIVAQEADAFLDRSRGLSAVPTVTALSEKAEAVRRAELEKTFARLNGIDEKGRQAIDALTQAIVRKILHPAIVAIKAEAGVSEGEAFIAAARRLFNLDENFPPHHRKAGKERDAGGPPFDKGGSGGDSPGEGSPTGPQSSAPGGAG